MLKLSRKLNSLNRVVENLFISLVTLEIQKNTIRIAS